MRNTAKPLYGRPMDGTTDRRETYVVETGDGGCVRISATAHEILAGFEGGATAAEIAGGLRARLGREVTAAQVEAAHLQLRKRLAAVGRQETRRRPFGLWFRARLLPAPTVDRLSRLISPLLHPVVAAVGMLLVVLAVVDALTGGLPGQGGTMGSGGYAPTLALMALSMLGHELGHTSAAARYGAPAREIGFGLYIVYPVFFSDVTGAWGLPRRRRLAVDAAGVYVQLLIGAGYLLAYRLTGWVPLFVAAVMIFFVAVFVLLPVFKFDGYWLLTDLLGVVNLSRQVRRVAVHLVRRLRGLPDDPLPWPRRVSAMVLGYGVLAVSYLVLFAVTLARVVPELAAGYPARLAALMRDLYVAPHTPAPGRLASLMGPTYVLLGVSFAVLAVVRGAVLATRASRRRREAARPRSSTAGTAAPHRTEKEVPHG
ncbi:hypothetical protein AB0M28_38300 [Streptomyces sp. NPDC051940]|uniref:hypothetical protein n=1 Tax=Streptomyces sp. NPDC051940 TaxID=3155675 RepID=UPI00343A8505